MSLRFYRMPRLVVLKPSTPVLDAAERSRTTTSARWSCQDEGRVVGIVTDRDLAVRAVGHALDPRTTPLAEVMTTPVDDARARRRPERCAAAHAATQHPAASPWWKPGRLVGIVTLDDLLLDEAAPLDQVAAVVRGQIGEGGPAASVRSPPHGGARPRPGDLRALLNRLRSDADLETSEQAETALEVVLGSLVRRLTPDEAKDLIAQLPSLLHPRCAAPGPDKGITRQTIETELGERLDVDPPRAASLLDVVVGTIARIVSPGQMSRTCETNSRKGCEASFRAALRSLPDPHGGDDLRGDGGRGMPPGGVRSARVRHLDALGGRCPADRLPIGRSDAPRGGRGVPGRPGPRVSRARRGQPAGPGGQGGIC